LLESCLGISDEVIIRNTVERLPQGYIVPFLSAVIEKFQQRPARGIIVTSWIRAILVSHAGFLMTVPNLVQALSALYLTVDARLTLFKKFLGLSGRLDLLLAHVQAPPDGQMSVNARQTPRFRYVDSDDEDVASIDDEGLFVFYICVFVLVVIKK